MRVCVCVGRRERGHACVFAHVAQSHGGKQRVGDTRQLNGTGARRGLQDNVGLTDPTKWAITSQQSDLGRESCHSAGSVDS